MKMMCFSMACWLVIIPISNTGSVGATKIDITNPAYQIVCLLWCRESRCCRLNLQLSKKCWHWAVNSVDCPQKGIFNLSYPALCCLKIGKKHEALLNAPNALTGIWNPTVPCTIKASYWKIHHPPVAGAHISAVFVYFGSPVWVESSDNQHDVKIEVSTYFLLTPLVSTTARCSRLEGGFLPAAHIFWHQGSAASNIMDEIASKHYHKFQFCK